MTTTLTRKEAIDTIEFAYSQFFSDLPIKDGEIQTIAYAVNNDLQIRDFVLGLPATYGMFNSIDFVNYLVSRVEEKDSFAFNTVLALYNIEIENFYKASELLTKSEDVNPGYNLTKLAKRIISAGWEGSALTTMRNELHKQVLEIILDEPNYAIGEI